MRQKIKIFIELCAEIRNQSVKIKRAASEEF
jgi:hypothetical protein